MHAFETLKVPVGRIGIHWFGQNSFALKDSTGAIVLTDPYFPHDRPAGRFVHPEPPLDEASLRADFVLLTHDHGDHTCVESLERVRQGSPEATFVGPVESMRRLSDAGFPEEALITITAGETISLGALTIHAHWSKPPEGVPEEGISRPDVQHLGYVIEMGGVKVYVTGDLINTFAEHDELIGPIAALEPDVGLLTMHPTEGEFPYFDRAVKIAVKLGLNAVVPAHYDCFAKRTYDPYAFAALLPPDGPAPLVIGYNQAVVYPAI